MRRLLARLRRISTWLRARITVVLLVLVYVLAFPLLAAVRRLRPAAPDGWRRRDDPDVASLDRLRSLF